MIEWGCDVYCKNVKNFILFEIVKNDDFKRYFIGIYKKFNVLNSNVMWNYYILWNNYIYNLSFIICMLVKFICIK